MDAGQAGRVRVGARAHAALLRCAPALLRCHGRKRPVSAVDVTRMLAVSYAPGRPGDVDLIVGQRDRPDPGPHQVRVRVRTSGVNPTDWKARQRPIGPATTGAVQVPHHDGTGVIDAVGSGVDAARIGERVWVWFAAWQNPWGTAAQWTVVPEEHAVPLPDSASDELGACLGIPGLTAHQCLFADGPIEGRTVLVTGGAGAVGHAAIELARWAGARVLATASTPEKAELARSAGADAVVDYRAEDAAAQLLRAAPGGVDRVVEVALGANLPTTMEVCAPHASVSVYASEPSEPVIPVRRLVLAGMTLRFVLVFAIPGPALRRAVTDISSAVRAGALTSLPIRCFALEDTVAAHTAVRAGGIGRVVVDVP